MKMGKMAMGVLAAGTLALAIGGCDVHEKFTYVSSPSVPQTVTLRDTTTGEQVWSYDVPAGQELKLWFTTQPAQANSQGFDEMVWTVGQAGVGVPAVQNRLRVPPPMSRRIDGGVRAPELQKVSGMNAATPSVSTTTAVPIVTPPNGSH